LKLDYGPAFRPPTIGEAPHFKNRKKTLIGRSLLHLGYHSVVTFNDRSDFEPVELLDCAAASVGSGRGEACSCQACNSSIPRFFR
jgi:hypothetical protein